MFTPTLRARRRRLAALMAVAGLVFAACADEESTPNDAAGPTAAAAPADDPATSITSPAAPVATDAETTAATEPPGPEPFQVDATLRDFAIDIPAEIPSGFVRISATNGGSIGHHLILARIAEGVTYDDWLATFHESEFAAEAMLTFYGGPNGVLPGTTVSTMVNLVPGTYVALCLVPGSDGASHASHGMMASVTVTEGGPAADLAALDIEGTVSVTENEFTLSPGFDGHGKVLVRNDGAEIHEMVITHLGEGATFDDLRSSLAAGGSPEGTTLSGDYAATQGVTAISPGVEIVVELDLEEGDYVLSCLAPDLTDFLPHTMHGEILLVHYPS